MPWLRAGWALIASIGLSRRLRRAQTLAVVKADPHATIAELEQGLGLVEEDYDSMARLTQRLTAHLDGTPASLAFTYVTALMSILAMERRNREAWRVLHAFVGLDPDQHGGGEQLARALQARLSGEPPDIEILAVYSVVGGLGALGRDSEAVDLLRTDLGLQATPEWAPAAKVDELMARLALRPPPGTGTRTPVA